MSIARTDGALTIADCARRLASVPTGRLIYTDGALPAVRPVTFAAVRGEIVIYTGHDPLFDRLENWLLTFEAGHLDPDTRTGWTVLVHGHAHLRTVPGLGAGFDPFAGLPWHTDPLDGHLVLDIERITGHHLTLPRPDGDHR
ncbi:hypothetical protein R1CP_37055 (plasmid) [Rhodococcus opacus]|uniref:Pyridoxamine 5'-phosphate oxidase family protein n=1 Tax=Rhodococcus opacus TaxID=37919 RepID=A0A1B1KHD2_RHOOP|nr:pyridoxamine 5'-phosphate oxidase family protein [Rhodococcus opacus]ANS32017.1 hypothetical protein R1CP_37055 [Rhodococcus opacus]